jgi:hypothetical protein
MSTPSSLPLDPLFTAEKYREETPATELKRAVSAAP